MRGKFGAVAALTLKRTSEGSDALAAAAGAIAPRSGALRRANAVRLAGTERQFKRGLEPRTIIFEDELPIVEMGDCLGKREAEPGAFRRAARIQAAEAPPRFALELLRNAWTVVGFRWRRGRNG